MISIFIFTKYLNRINEKKKVQFSLEDENEKRWKRLELKYDFLNLTLLTNPSIEKGKTIIYQCESICGGLADRLRGIIMCYFLSILLNRQLIIDMAKPCPFTNYFQRNQYQWIDANGYEVKGSFRHIRSIDHNQQLANELQNNNFVKDWSEYSNIELSINIDFFWEIFSNKYLQNHFIIRMFVKGMTIDQINFQSLFSLFFQILFKPTKKIVQIVDQILENRSRKDLICTHLRIGKNPSNPHDYSFPYQNNITKIFIDFILEKEFLKKNSLSSLFVTSDSLNSTNEILHSFPNQSFTNVGPILHIDLGGNNNCDEGFSKVVSDFYLLGECSTLILTSSGFSGYANRRRTNPYRNTFKFNQKRYFFQKCEDVSLISPWEHRNHSTDKFICPTRSNYLSFTFI